MATNMQDRATRLYDQGVRLLFGPEPEQAAVVLGEAMEAGSGHAAARLAVLSAAGVCCRQDWTTALDLLETAAGLGDRSAQKQLGLLTKDTEIATRIRLSPSHGPAVWRKARASIEIADVLISPPASVISHAPRAATIKAFVSADVQRWLILRGKAGLGQAMINDPATGIPRPDPMRTSAVTRLGLAETDLIVLATQARIAAATGYAFEHMEPSNVILYRPGQEYRPHYDFFDPASVEFQAEIATFGQRVATFLVYLNDDFDGGETDFPDAGLRYRGKAGDALLFSNVLADGQPDKATLHAGLPPTRGQKWLLSQWIRTRVQAIS